MKFLFYSVVLFSLQVSAAFAQGASAPANQGPAISAPANQGPAISAPAGSNSINNPLDGSGITSIIGFFQAILDIILIFAVPVIVFFIIYAGFNYVTARGNTEKIKAAHNAILYALIGGVIVLGANVILDIIGNTVCDIVEGGTVCDSISN